MMDERAFRRRSTSLADGPRGTGSRLLRPLPVGWPARDAPGRACRAVIAGRGPAAFLPVFRPGPNGVPQMTDPEVAPPRRTPLTAVHERLGATLTDFAGWLMPLRYGSELAERRAVRTAAGLFDLSHMGEITVTGPDAAGALDYALVGNLSAVAPG